MVRRSRCSSPNAPRVETNYNVAEKVLDVIANPNVAFILLGLGQLALIIELWSPGLVGPGIFGVIMLIAGFFALGPLDANPAGIALIVLALVLFAAEIFVVGFGVLGIGGIISLLLGGLILFSDTSVDAQGVSIWTLAVIGSIAGSLLLILGLMIAVDRRQPAWTPAGVGNNLIGNLGTDAHGRDRQRDGPAGCGAVVGAHRITPNSAFDPRARRRDGRADGRCRADGAG